MWRFCLIFLITEQCVLVRVLSSTRFKNSPCGEPKKAKNVDGADVVIGGLIPVHVKEKLNQPGLIWAEAMMFAIDEINKKRDLLGDIKLGYDIRDSCNDAHLALHSALDFVLTPRADGSYERKLSNGTSCLCNKNADHDSMPPVVAVVGGATSGISTTVSTVLSADNIPQISYSSTSPSLSDKTKYRNFMRTIPSDVYQAEAIADILVKFNWTFVSIVVSEEEYGRNGLIALRKTLKEKNVCVAVEASFSTNSYEIEKDVNAIIRQLEKDTRQRVVVLWCARPAAVQFFKIATGRLFNITWIGTESWGDSKYVRDEVNFDLIGGMLGIVPYLAHYGKFEEHLRSLTPRSRSKNPWINEYWKSLTNNKCAQMPHDCSEDKLPNAMSLPLNKYTYVIDAVYAIAHGIQSLKRSHRNLNVSRLNKRMLMKLIHQIKTANFKAFSADGNFNFTDKGDPHYGAYSIRNLQGNHTHKKFVTIAQWNGETSKLEFDDTVKIQWNDRKGVPRSKCADECQPGFGFVASDRKCCWSCPKCQAGYYKPKKGNVECKACDDGFMSNDARTHCIKVTEDYLRWNSPLSIFVMVSCFIGLVIIVFTLAVFRHYSTTAVVKASNREVSIFHLTCHGLLFLLPVLYIGRPNVPTCAMRLLLFPVLFTFITAIMFLKTDRIVRIFNSKARLTKRSRLLSNKVQFVLTLVLTSIPLIGTCIWIILRPLRIDKEAIGDVFVVYCENEESCQIVQLSYILLLALLCTFEAFHARKLPESFNEAKFICFSMFAFVLLWMGYIPVFIDQNGSTKQFLTCLFIILINLLSALLIYLPKLNIILFHPESNRHQSFKKSTQSSGLKDTQQLSPRSTPSTSREQKTSLEMSEDQKTNSMPDKKIHNFIFGSNEQLVAHHLGLPDAKRSSIPYSKEMDNVFITNPATSF